MSSTSSLFASTALLADGWCDRVRLEIGAGGQIERIELDVEPAAGDFLLEGHALLPAPGNVHSHAHQRLMAGLGERRGPGGDDFWSWREVMYALLAEMTPDHLEAVAAYAYKAMLEAGYAAVGEFHYLHHGPRGRAYDSVAEMASRIAAAAETTGIGLTLLPVLYCQGGVGGEPLSAVQRRFAADVDGFVALVDGAGAAVARLGADSRIGVAVHSLRAVDPASLARVLAAHDAGPVHIHAAEQLAEVEAVQAALGATPVAWLLDNADVDRRWCLVHATHMTAGECDALARSGAVAGICPITEANLGDGIFDAVRYRAAGGIVGFGTDSNVLISLVEELRSFEYSQRLRARARCVAAEPGGSTGKALLDAALVGGARALGRAAGTIAERTWADLVAVDLGSAGMASRTGDAILDSWIFAGAGVVAEVWSAGRHVVTRGRHVDAARIEDRYRHSMSALLGDR